MVTIDGYEDVPANDDNALMKAAAHQPVSVGIEAGGLEFQFYLKVGILLFYSKMITVYLNTAPDRSLRMDGYDPLVHLNGAENGINTLIEMLPFPLFSPK